MLIGEMKSWEQMSTLWPLSRTQKCVRKTLQLRTISEPPPSFSEGAGGTAVLTATALGMQLRQVD